MLGTKVILIVAEICSIVSALLLVWMICLGQVVADETKAFAVSVFILAAVGLQSVQQEIPWE